MSDGEVEKAGVYAIKLYVPALGDRTLHGVAVSLQDALNRMQEELKDKNLMTAYTVAEIKLLGPLDFFSGSVIGKALES